MGALVDFPVRTIWLEEKTVPLGIDDRAGDVAQAHRAAVIDEREAGIIGNGAVVPEGRCAAAAGEARSDSDERLPRSVCSMLTFQPLRNLHGVEGPSRPFLCRGFPR